MNHTIVDSADFQLQANDLISIQGFGRAHITDLGGKTKKIKRTLPIEHYSNSNDLRRITNAFYTKMKLRIKEFSRVKNGLEPTEVANFWSN